ncbi:MAG: hypothetical protein R3234_03975 [Thermoanaerobaculia bacterium]|nr:hypothetical protein [Thermoanaerobaculia bacterium]
MTAGDTGSSSRSRFGPESRPGSWKTVAGRNERGEVRTLVLWDGA